MSFPIIGKTKCLLIQRCNLQTFSNYWKILVFKNAKSADVFSIFWKTLYKLRWGLRLLAYFTNSQNNRIDGAVCWTQRVLFQLLQNLGSPVALEVLSCSCQ